MNRGQNSFITLAPGVNVIKLFWPLFTKFSNKLECFVPSKLLQPSVANTLNTLSTKIQKLQT